MKLQLNLKDHPPLIIESELDCIVSRLTVETKNMGYEVFKLPNGKKFICSIDQIVMISEDVGCAD